MRRHVQMHVGSFVARCSSAARYLTAMRPAISVAAILAFVCACSSDELLTNRLPPPPRYIPGTSYYGRNNYIEYIAGNAPVILTAAHGGALNPASIPDRTAAACGVAPTTVTDLNTTELVRAMQRRYFARFGTYPHVIISNLARRKLDPNRVNPEASCGSAEAPNGTRSSTAQRRQSSPLLERDGTWTSTVTATRSSVWSSAT
jgi:hypothetical protein